MDTFTNEKNKSSCKDYNTIITTIINAIFFALINVFIVFSSLFFFQSILFDNYDS